MIPAMDRTLPVVRFRVRPWASLVVGFCLGSIGCTKLQSLRGENAPPPMIGRVMESPDIYAQANHPQSPGAEGRTLGRGGGPNNGQVVVDGIKLHEVEVQPTGTTISESPEPSDPASNSPMTSTRVGVPDSARSIASGARAPRKAPEVAQLVSEARSAVDRMESYQVAMHRQERVNGSLFPEEDVILAVRRAPRAIRLTWPSGPHQGREVIYRADEPNRVMHINQPGPISRLTLPIDSPLVMKNSRHPISEAGFDSLVEALETALQSADGTVLSVQQVTNSAGNASMPVLIRKTADGETWRIIIDPQTHLPAIVECLAANGDLLELYQFRDIQPNLAELATAEAFEPNARWGAPRGLFGRLGGSNPGSASAPAADGSPR